VLKKAKTWLNDAKYFKEYPMPTCIVCKGEYYTTYMQCTKCGVNNESWETERTRSGASRALQFFLGSIWGLLALSSLVLPAVSIVAYDYIQPVASVRIGVPLAIIVCLVIFLFTYALRFSTREYELLRQVRKGRQPTLALMALLAFTLALVLALAVVFVLEAREMETRRLEALNLKARKLEVLYLEALDLARKLESLDLARKLEAFYLEALDLQALDKLSPIGGLTRVMLTVSFSLTFVNVTLSAMLMSIRSFAKRLNELVPQPIFLRDDLLVDVVIKVAEKQLGGKTTLSLVEMSRTDDGGIKALVKDEVQEKQWELEADHWGRRLSIKRPKTW
jgi:hypothetical protein